AEGVERQVVEEELGAVFEQQRHAVSVTIAGATVVAAQPLDLRTHLRVRVLDTVGMIGAVRRRRRTEEGVLGRGVRGRGESLVDGLHGPADSSAKGEPGRSWSTRPDSGPVSSAQRVASATRTASAMRT